MTTTRTKSAPDAGNRGDATAPALPQLRRRRQELLAERSRSRYLLRLVQAQLDVTIAGAIGPQDGPTPSWQGLPTPPSAAEVGALLVLPGQDLGARLESLRDVLIRLARYDDALSRACDLATDELVTVLVRRPSACL